jgi:hypothetical protein
MRKTVLDLVAIPNSRFENQPGDSRHSLLALRCRNAARNVNTPYSG